MKSYRTIPAQRLSRIRTNRLIEGETIEQKIRRIMDQNEPITDGAELIFTERKDGILPEYNPRTDKWDIALDAMTTVAKTNIAKREAKIVEMKKVSGAESADGTSDASPEATS